MTRLLRVLPACESPRFRIVRLWRVDGKVKAENVGSADTPSEAMRAVFEDRSSSRVVAVDRRGYAYADTGKPIATKGTP